MTRVEEFFINLNLFGPIILFTLEYDLGIFEKIFANYEQLRFTANNIGSVDGLFANLWRAQRLCANDRSAGDLQYFAGFRQLDPEHKPTSDGPLATV